MRPRPPTITSVSSCLNEMAFAGTKALQRITRPSTTATSLLVVSLGLYVLSLSTLPRSSTQHHIAPSIGMDPSQMSKRYAPATLSTSVVQGAELHDVFDYEGHPEWSKATKAELLQVANRSVIYFGESKSRVVIMTAGNFKYRAVLLNFLVSLARLKHTPLVIALDREIGTFLEDLGMQTVFDCWRGEPSFIRGALPSSSNHLMVDHRPLRAVWKLRTQVLSALLTSGNSVVMSDTDAIWLRDPARWLHHGIGDVVAR